jgi:hypothetical protein
MDKEALRAAQNVLHNILYADMNPAKAGRHVSSETLTRMIIKAYLDNVENISELNELLAPYRNEVFNKGDKEFNKGIDCAIKVITENWGRDI